ncbi:HNH endonuclease [Cupriavidus gilardii]|uniref:HNH endonuclease n=1 Tax=Cupriavidus gilardii TaxID=82541 RepID=A0ABY4VNY0_9BURK|nr:HNH endonuclease [Cupriavidus gilardii]USE78946.1 HNH endonuclease [Cupriavidus gilardii]USE79529.1 HNH endonuclease [Cupriavidus gilardii]
MKIIRAANGQEIRVSDEDYDDLSRFRWFIDRDGYALRNARLAPKQWYMERMHRRIVGLQRGDKRQVDHINGNPLDNRRSNLRVCTHAENQLNIGRQRNNTSGFKGVCFDKQAGKFKAAIAYQGRRKNLGLFDTPEAAYEAYCAAAAQLHGEFARY